MSSSSSSTRTSPRVLRDAARVEHPSGLLALDLAPSGLARLDPARLESAVEEGRAAGFDAGFRAGHLAGLEAARAEQDQVTADHRARLASVLSSADSAVADALTRIGEAMETGARATVRAAFAIAEAVVGRELAIAADPGRDAVARALALAPDGVEVSLHLHPQDAASLVDDDLLPRRGVTVVADPTLRPGDCVGTAGWTTIDARIGTALDRVRAVLEVPR